MEVDTTFRVDQVSDIIKETVDRIIGNNVYLDSRVNRWTADVVDQILTELMNLNKPFKYIVQAVSYFI
jgi:dynein light chain Tctex-type 1